MWRVEELTKTDDMMECVQLWDTFVEIAGECESEVAEQRTVVEVEGNLIAGRFRELGGNGYNYGNLCEDLKAGKGMGDHEKSALEKLKTDYESWKSGHWEPLRERLTTLAIQAVQERDQKLKVCRWYLA